MGKKLSHLGEFGLIELIRKSSALTGDVVRGIGDDAAVLNFSGAAREYYQLFTTDMLLEDVHFTRKMNARLIGRKALACNISDVSAMGGTPSSAVVSLAVPPDLKIRFIEDIYRGINHLAKRFGMAIVGGDTVKSEKIVINIALLGRVKKKQLVTRGGASAGDMIFVTGPLGRSFQTGKHLSFTPRVAQAQFLVNHFKPTAMIDISDGLCADLGHILKMSDVGVCLYEENIPKTKNATLQQALSDGEDFELLFTLSKKDEKFLLRKKHKSFDFYFIGEIIAVKKKIILIKKDGSQQIIPFKGFTHF